MGVLSFFTMFFSSISILSSSIFVMESGEEYHLNKHYSKGVHRNMNFKRFTSNYGGRDLNKISTHESSMRNKTVKPNKFEIPFDERFVNGGKPKMKVVEENKSSNIIKDEQVSVSTPDGTKKIDEVRLIKDEKEKKDDILEFFQEENKDRLDEIGTNGNKDFIEEENSSNKEEINFSRKGMEYIKNELILKKKATLPNNPEANQNIANNKEENNLIASNNKQQKIGENLRNRHIYHKPVEAVKGQSAGIVASKNKTEVKELFYPKRYSKLFFDQTPALVGAAKGSISCDINADSLVYWNDPQGQRDISFKSPFSSKGKTKKYLTFEPDHGGWNNMRMSLEIMFVIAAATERILVLPPDQTMYLLNQDSQRATRGFADFFNLKSNKALDKRLEIITTREFLQREVFSSNSEKVPDEVFGSSKIKEDLLNLSQTNRCYELMAFQGNIDLNDTVPCSSLEEFLRNHPSSVIPQMKGDWDGNCLIFDRDYYEKKTVDPTNLKRIKNFCANKKQNDNTILFYNSSDADPLILHFRLSLKETRILDHFYTFMLFTDPVIDNYMKRLVRDFLHYNDEIFCAAAKVVKAIQKDATSLKIGVIDDYGSGGYTSLHIRRGDFQYEDQKISAEQIYESIKDVILPNELLYIATDEKNKTFFDPIAKHGHILKFLDDYWDKADLMSIDSNYFGMIDTIVASHGRVFFGTCFSTFTNFINRMRGYLGLSMMGSFYTSKEYKTFMHEHPLRGFQQAWVREWPIGWFGIDSDRYIGSWKFSAGNF